MCDLLKKEEGELVKELAETGQRVREAKEAADGGPGKRPSPQRVPADGRPTSKAARHSNSGSHEDKTSGSAKDCEGQRQQPGVIPVSLESDDDDPEDQ